MAPTPLTFFALIFLIDFFRACRQFSSRSREIIQNLQFAVRVQIFSKNTFFALPPPTLDSVAHTTYA